MLSKALKSSNICTCFHTNYQINNLLTILVCNDTTYTHMNASKYLSGTLNNITSAYFENINYPILQKGSSEQKRSMFYILLQYRMAFYLINSGRRFDRVLEAQDIENPLQTRITFRFFVNFLWEDIYQASNSLIQKGKSFNFPEFMRNIINV